MDLCSVRRRRQPHPVPHDVPRGWISPKHPRPQSRNAHSTGSRLAQVTYKSPAPLPFRIGNGAADQCARIPVPAIRRQRIDAENHLPRTGFIVHGRSFIHPVGRSGSSVTKTVHKGDQLFPRQTSAEMIPIMPDPLGKLRFGRRFRRRKARRLHCGDRGTSRSVAYRISMIPPSQSRRCRLTSPAESVTFLPAAAAVRPRR